MMRFLVNGGCWVLSFGGTGKALAYVFRSSQSFPNKAWVQKCQWGQEMPFLPHRVTLLEQFLQYIKWGSKYKWKDEEWQQQHELGLNRWCLIGTFPVANKYIRGIKVCVCMCVCVRVVCMETLVFVVVDFAEEEIYLWCCLSFGYFVLLVDLLKGVCV